MYIGNYIEALKQAKSDKGMKKRFWLSVKKTKKCLFSRRNGYIGKIIFNYSVCFRLFGVDLI